jgi:GTPase KRas
MIDNEICVVDIVDTTCQQKPPSWRNQGNRNSEGFLLVYSITSRPSFACIEGFYREISQMRETAVSPENLGLTALQTLYFPVILVGSNSDR